MQQKAKTQRARELFREAELREESGDFNGAFVRLLEAARLGDSGAQLNLGHMYAAGKGTPTNLKMAQFWSKAAFRQGLSDAAINLSVYFERQKRIRGAKIWLRRAVSMGDGEACFLLAKLYLRHGPAKNDSKQLLTKALQLGPPYISDFTRNEAKKLLRKLEKE